MTYYIDIQNATEHILPLSEAELANLAKHTLKNHQSAAELTIRIVPSAEMIYLNNHYRKQNKPTNVLAFPCSLPKEVAKELEYPLLGDIIICPEVLLIESQQLNKSLTEHWSLIVIHGVLHLLGYDHIKEEEAQAMQAIEINLLAQLGFANPYLLEGNELE